VAFVSISVGDVVAGVDVASSSTVVAGDDVVGDGCDGSVGAAVGIVAVVVGILLSDSTIIFAFKTHLLDTVSRGHQPTATVEFPSLEKTGLLKVVHLMSSARGSNLNPLQSSML